MAPAHDGERDAAGEAGPRYVAIITDGNGRWAQRRGLPVIAGHEAGADTVKARLRDCVPLGVKELTVYSFSTENWSRTPEEVAGLLGGSWQVRACAARPRPATTPDGAEVTIHDSVLAAIRYRPLAPRA